MSSTVATFAEEFVIDQPRGHEAVCLEELAWIGGNGQTVLPSLDQTDLGNGRAVLMVNLWIGDYAPPLAWIAAVGTGHRVGKQVQDLGSGAGLVAEGSGVSVVGGSVLFLAEAVRPVVRPRLALPIATEE